GRPGDRHGVQPLLPDPRHPVARREDRAPPEGPPLGGFSQDPHRINPSPQTPKFRSEQGLLDSYVPVLIFVLIVFGLLGAVVTLSFVLGPAKPFRKKLAPYESGIIPDTPAVRRLSVRF